MNRWCQVQKYEYICQPIEGYYGYFPSHIFGGVDKPFTYSSPSKTDIDVSERLLYKQISIPL